MKSTRHTLPPLPPAEPGSIRDQMDKAHKLLTPLLALPRTHPDRLKVNEAALLGTKDCDDGQTLCPYEVGSIGWAAWLLAWMRRAREEE